eukprot:762768-Hanusia_phi.AAC.1
MQSHCGMYRCWSVNLAARASTCCPPPRLAWGRSSARRGSCQYRLNLASPAPRRHRTVSGRGTIELEMYACHSI